MKKYLSSLVASIFLIQTSLSSVAFAQRMPSPEEVKQKHEATAAADKREREKAQANVACAS